MGRSAYKRARNRVGGALGALLGVTLGLLLVVQVDDGGAANATKPAHRSATAGKGIGIAYGDRLVWMGSTELANTLDEAVSLNATWIRNDLGWDDVQWDGSSTYNWSNFDALVSAANSRELHVLPVLAYTPPWARAAGCTDSKCPPADPDAFAKFAGAAAARYAGKGIHTWELWNEENTPGFWVSPDPAAYATLLAKTSAAIKAVDPTATVMIGGLVFTYDGDGNYDARTFLDQVLQRVPCSAFDAVGAHPYTYPYLPSDTSIGVDSWDKMDRGSYNLVTVLTAHGCSAKPIWATEYGAPTQGPGNASDGSVATLWPTPSDHVTEAYQAQLASDGIATAAADAHVKALFWYTNSDLPGGTDPSYFYGLDRLDGTHKPSWSAFQQAAARVAAGSGVFTARRAVRHKHRRRHRHHRRVTARA